MIRDTLQIYLVCLGGGGVIMRNIFINIVHVFEKFEHFGNINYFGGLGSLSSSSTGLPCSTLTSVLHLKDSHQSN